MSAERLREAARVLRRVAEAATGGPWRWEQYREDLPFLIGRAGSPDTYEYDQEVIEAEHNGECGCRSACHLELSVRRMDRNYIAMMHPGVAMALADVLDVLAYVRENEGECDYMAAKMPDPTLVLADLILGGAS